MITPLTKWDAKIAFIHQAYKDGLVSKKEYERALQEVRFEKRMERVQFMNERKQEALNIN